MPSKKAAPASKPTYAVMVTESIKTLNDRTGSSVQAITKQLQTSYNIDINKPALIKAIKKGVEQGDFVQIKASYKLNKKPPATKPKKVAATTTVKKKAAPKTVTRKVTTTKKVVKPKKTIAKKAAAHKKSSTTSTKKATTTKPSTKKAATSRKKSVKK